MPSLFLYSPMYLILFLIFSFIILFNKSVYSHCRSQAWINGTGCVSKAKIFTKSNMLIIKNEILDQG